MTSSMTIPWKPDAQKGGLSSFLDHSSFIPRPSALMQGNQQHWIRRSENKAKPIDVSSYYAPFHTHTQLSPAELDFLTSNSSAALTAFESVSEKSGASEKLLAMAGSQVESAQK